MSPEDFLHAPEQPIPTINQLAERIPAYSNDDFVLDPLVPTVEDALVLPRQNNATARDITPPDALQLLNPSSST